ncbi:TonB-dependent receptor [Seonamhaeicola algicola]|uniref:TonB-dependent receptor n=1 Tax=Seonamhaeicola algicola TaxID=1719036 RepID=A0A5C7AQN2_9FLAO|nr:TonB-dependent receptor [Seonamhaeicola algicola]TXE09999.1 TonB-dependent receptor [Seonamhaeicola algicola]
MIRKPIKPILFFLLCFVFVSTNAQQLKGQVINTKNQPLEAAYIYNLNSKSHAHSLETGAFILNDTKVGDSIKIGLLGYNTKIVAVERMQMPITIQLSEKIYSLDELIISEQLNALSTITDLDLNTNPVKSSQEILRKVPGLIIGQHAGGGKAEQIFLRGFDIDHGTDIALSVDGMPVNMVSHAHGQGYSDLHFIIPETVNKIDFGKGPYYANKGDFNTAGYVDFSTKDYLNDNEISFGLGQFNTSRVLGMFNLLDKVNNQHAYLAVENLQSDGPFESPQNFNRLNMFGKYVLFTPSNDKITLTASHFTSTWDASGQIPVRAVNSGLISRFGAIDDTEGGTTDRTNFNVSFTKQVNDNTTFKTNAFYSNYNFELFSNFTFFLEDEDNGDQIKQKESRNIFGLNTAFTTETFLNDVEVNLNYGLSFRHDISNNNELSKTINKTTLNEAVQLGDINQTNTSAFFNAAFTKGKFTFAPGIRLDNYKFIYKDALNNTGETLSESKTIFSPKLNLFYTANNNLKWFLKSGIGFHSNDTRVVVTNAQENILPKAYGVDFGNIWKPTKKLFINTALWYLYLQQEFVYVGDAGVVEPSGKTERYGVDFGVRYQFSDHLYFNTDATYTKARSIEEDEGNDYIPLAPDFTVTGGLSLQDYKGFSGSINYRYLDDRPANEDNSIVADGYFVTDINANYTIKNITFGVVIENLFDTEWNETQFATESRLQNETTPVEEIHFTPGTPFFIKGVISYKF